MILSKFLLFLHFWQKIHIYLSQLSNQFWSANFHTLANNYELTELHWLEKRQIVEETEGLWGS